MVGIQYIGHNMVYFKTRNKFIVNPNKVYKFKQLPSGCYIPTVDFNTRQFYFDKFEIKSDAIINLPSKEYEYLTSSLGLFLKPESKEKYSKLNFLYKRSALLHGSPGTGKSILVNRIALDVLKINGIILFASEIDALKIALSSLNETQPDCFVLVILEEFDSIVKQYESELLTLLDGQVQKNNVMYLATTNYLKRIPKRLYRPGRINSVLEIKYPNLEARTHYFQTKLKDFNVDITELATKTKDLSVDELKEVIQSVFILEDDLENTIERIKTTRVTEFDQEEETPRFPTKTEKNSLQKLFKNIFENY